MTSTYVADIGTGRPVLVSKLLLSLRGRAYRSYFVGIEDGMCSLVFCGSRRDKVTPTNAGSLFAKMMQRFLCSERTDLLLVGPPVGLLVHITDPAVAVSVDSSNPDPTRRLVTAIFDGVMQAFPNCSIAGVMTMKELQRLALHLSFAAAGVRGKANRKAAATTADRTKIIHWGFRAHSRWPHSIGAAA